MDNTTLFLYVASPPEWRQWLDKNHGSVKEIWLVFFKKQTGKPCLTYEYAVEEALCWGWIDSIIKRIDENTYARKFTPRTDTTQWSALNLTRMRRLIQEGRVTEIGLAKIDMGLLDGSLKPAIKPSDRITTMPPEIKTVLAADPIVWQNFNNLSSREQKNYLGWICTAKKEETRQRRLQEAVAQLAQNKKLGLK